MEEKNTSGEIDTNDAPLNQTLIQERQRIKKERRLVISLVVMFGIVFAGIWWWSTLRVQRELIELTYCGFDNANNHAHHKCSDYKIRIPFIYYGGYPLDFSRKVPEDEQSLEVAYPSMQPWNSLTSLEKRNSQKIEINIWGTTSQTVNDLIKIYSFGSMTAAIKTTRSPNFVYGLVQFLDEPEPHYSQFLMPQEPNPRMFLQCAYRDLNPDMYKLGCKDSMFTTWGLKLELHHKLILLPHWSDIHDKVQILIQSFVVLSEISGGK